MKQKIYQIDAFTSEVFKGNPAAVCPLDEWLDDSLMQSIATENNLSELINSTNRKVIKENLNNYNLSAGCANCQNLIDSEKYKAIGSHQYDMIPLKKDYPTMMEFELSNLCNFACIMCSPMYSSTLEKL